MLMYHLKLSNHLEFIVEPEGVGLNNEFLILFLPVENHEKVLYSAELYFIINRIVLMNFTHGLCGIKRAGEFYFSVHLPL